MPAAQPALEKPLGESDFGESAFAIPTRDQVRVWGARSFVSLLDQGLTSAAGFVANVLLARWMPAAEYGAFAVAFAGYLFLTLFHNALLLEPLSVIGPARHVAHLGEYFRAQLRVHGVLVWPLTAITLAAALILLQFAVHTPLVGALIGGGVSLPLLLMLWLTRRMCYVLQRPLIAALGSGLYFVFSLAAIVALHAVGRLTPFASLVALALGSLIGSLVIFRKVIANSRPDKRDARVPWRSALAENWTYGRWVIGSALFYAISTLTQTFFTAGALGLSAVGILRAMQVPSQAMTQIIAAIGLVVLPALSYDFGRGQYKRLRHNAFIVSTTLGITATGFALCMVPCEWRFESVLYGGKYVAYARLIPLLALIPVCNGLCTGYSMALRASQKPHYDLISNGVASAVALISTIPFVRRWGVAGAAISMVLSFAVMNLVTLIFFLLQASDKTQQLQAMEAETRSFPGVALEDDV
jgi:O-antigen/teichoic acid export membrane protein